MDEERRATCGEEGRETGCRRTGVLAVQRTAHRAVRFVSGATTDSKQLFSLCVSNFWGGSFFVTSKYCKFLSSLRFSDERETNATKNHR